MGRKKRTQREGNYAPMPRALIFKSRRMFCEVCGTHYESLVVSKGALLKVRQVIDHLFPVRLLLKMKLEPHTEVNMISVCATCHGRKLKHEDRIFRGDVHSFIAGLNLIGYPLHRVVAAARHYEFLEVEKFVPRERAEKEFLALTDQER